MPAIKEQQWQEVSVHTWGDLAAHLWEDFRLALMETETEQEAHGVVLEIARTAAETSTVMNAQGVAMELSPAVMQTRTQMIVSIVVSDRDYRREMLRALPLYERKSSVFDQVLTGYDREFRRSEQKLKITERNLFVDTAIEALPVYERDLGIDTDARLTYDQRREQITAKNRAAFDQTTEETIKQVAAAYGNGEVDVYPLGTPGVYAVKFIGIGIPNNMNGLKRALDVIVPAHLQLEYIFTFSPWQDLRGVQWGTAQESTWDELRTWNEVS